MFVSKTGVSLKNIHGATQSTLFILRQNVLSYRYCVQVTFLKMSSVTNSGQRSQSYVHLPVESSLSTAGFHGFQNLSTIGCRNLCQSHKTTGITIQEMQTIFSIQYFEWLFIEVSALLPFFCLNWRDFDFLVT